MLQRIRDGLQAKRWVAGSVLGALALVFAAWGAYGIVDISIGSGNYAAKVNGEKISVKEAQEGWQRQQQAYEQQFRNELPAEMKAGLQERFLEGLVRDTLIASHSQKLGYRVSDDMVRAEVQSNPRFQVEGQYSPDAARYALAQIGMSEFEFENALRAQLQRSQVAQGLRISEFMTPAEKARLQKLESEQREVRYATISPDKFAAAAKIDDAAVEAYYKANQARFMTPEFVQLVYGELRLDQVASQVQISDEELKAEYDKSKDSYVQPEQRHVRHILIESGQDDAAAQKKAQEAFAEAKAAKDFGAVAKQYSQDAGSAAQGGDLGWIKRDAFDKAFTDAAFTMSVGEVRGPVKTSYGYHVIKVDEIQPGKTRTLEEVRPEIEAALRKAKAANSFGDVQEQIQQKVEQPGADFDALVKEFNLQTGEVAQFERGKGGGALGDSPELEDVAFSSPVVDEHKIGGPVALGEDRLVLVKALQHAKPTPKPLASVHDEIVATLRKDQANQAAARAADAARARLEIGTPFDQVAKEAGVTADAAHFISRDDPSVPQQIRSLVFQAPRPVDGKPLYRSTPLETGGAAFIAVSAVRTEPSSDPSLVARQQQDATLRHGEGDAMAYMDELRRAATVSKNPKAFE
jgi:peptidyl-prolyl cis-trans isomerase D